jgi:hypothetical protein
MPKTTFPTTPSPGVTGCNRSVWGDRRFAVIGGARLLERSMRAIVGEAPSKTVAGAKS